MTGKPRRNRTPADRPSATVSTIHFRGDSDTPERHFHASMTRISDLASVPYETTSLDREEWATGDYVVAEVLTRSSERMMELTTGRMIELAEGDLIVGALGKRYATLEATGTWEEVTEDGKMEILTGGGLFGRCTSRSMLMPTLPEIRYRAHVTRDGAKVCMGDFVEAPESRVAYEIPTILIIGTSMSAGKTTAGRVLVRRLKSMGLRVVAAKVTGAGRARDMLSMLDAGADSVMDFVDVGLPSTVHPEDEYREALDILLARMAATASDVAVVEVGASPMEPYNGEAAVARLEDAVRMTVLCASDPYAVVGVTEAFGTKPDLVTGITSNTQAGVDLVEELTGFRCLNVRDKDSLPELDELLRERLGVDGALG